MSSHGGTRSPEHFVSGAALVSPCPLQAPIEHHSPVLNQAVGHGSSGQSAVITGLPLSAILAKPSTATAAHTSNRHSRPGAHCLPAGSFIGGFRTPAPLARVDRSRWAGIRNPNRRTLARHHGPVPDQAIEHHSSDHSAVITGAQLSAIFAKLSTATAAQTSNRHNRPGVTAFPRVPSSEAFERRPP